MSDASDQERAQDLARLWQGSVTPVADETDAEARRARIVPALGDAIGRSAERRRRERSVRRLSATLAVAATVLLAIGVGRQVAESRGRAVAPEASATSVSGFRSLSGAVTLVRGERPIVVERSTLETGDHLKTSPDAVAEVRLTNLVLAELGGASDLSVMAPRAAAHRVRLDRGRLDAHVDDRPSALPKLVVETPDVEVVVTGTVFEVDVTGSRTGTVTSVSVEKGRVVVRRHGAELARVSAGQRWSSAALAPVLTAPPVADSPPPVRAAGPTTRSRVPGAPPVAAAHEIAPEPAGTLAAENRLFQAAAEARKRSDDAEAIARLGELLTTYPGSPLAGEARVERMRAFGRLGRAGDAEREAQRYLADYPGGFAREEARRLVMPEPSP